MKGTPSMGRKTGKKTHFTCRRCGNCSYHKTHRVCSSCGFGRSSKLRSFSWQTKLAKN